MDVVKFNEYIIGLINVVEFHVYVMYALFCSNRFNKKNKRKENWKGEETGKLRR